MALLRSSVRGRSGSRLAVAALMIAAACSDNHDETPAEATPTATTRAASSRYAVALLRGTPGNTFSELVFQSSGDPPAPGVVRVDHAPYAELRGVLLPSSRRALVVADLEKRRDNSFASVLLSLEAGRSPLRLADQLAYSTRPMLTPGGRVFVARGSAGAPPDASAVQNGELRTDHLSVDEVDLGSGSLRTLHSIDGYATHLAAATNHELFVYRVWHRHADVVAIDVDSGRVRVLLPDIPAFARDFSLSDDGGSLYFTNLEPADETWYVARLDLASLRVDRLLSSRSIALVPHAWPGGGFVATPDGRSGLASFGATPALNAPLGDGADVVRGFSGDRRWALMSHERPSVLPEPYLVDLADGSVTRVPAPPGTRVELLGVLP